MGRHVQMVQSFKAATPSASPVLRLPAVLPAAPWCSCLKASGRAVLTAGLGPQGVEVDSHHRGDGWSEGEARAGGTKRGQSVGRAAGATNEM